MRDVPNTGSDAAQSRGIQSPSFSDKEKAKARVPHVSLPRLILVLAPLGRWQIHPPQVRSERSLEVKKRPPRPSPRSSQASPQMTLLSCMAWEVSSPPPWELSLGNFPCIPQDACLCLSNPCKRHQTLGRKASIP
jgi:hypothetical protein